VRPAPVLKAPARKPAKSKIGSRKTRRLRLSLSARIVLGCVALVLALLTWGALARAYAPRGNTNRTRFDAIIVLGNPADSDGNPSPPQLARVTEGVREYGRGVAPRLILTGGAVVNKYAEARVMARTAEAQGIPPSAIFVEPDAQNTIQNACFSARIMKEHGWTSAEVISDRFHLPRAGLIFNRLAADGKTPFEWRAHIAPSLGQESAAWSATYSLLETMKTVRYLLYARQTEACEP
jgi:uncharacterized SAM-binding protein YcdF (DUF218 family)